jgi:hypothetical protein
MLYLGLHWSGHVRVAPEMSSDRRARGGADQAVAFRAHQRAAGAACAHRFAGCARPAEQGHCRATGHRAVQVARWRERWLKPGLEGIERDLPRGAPPVKVDVKHLVELTTQQQARSGHALEHAQAGCAVGCGCQHGVAALAVAWPEAAHRARLQGLARPAVRREARGHRGPVHVPARARPGAVLRREEPGAGAGPHAAWACR